MKIVAAINSTVGRNRQYPAVFRRMCSHSAQNASTLLRPALFKLIFHEVSFIFVKLTMQGVIQIHLAFDHASGQEMQGKRYALVVSPQAFNRFDLAWVCPISQGAAELARSRGFLVTLTGAGTATQGAVFCHELKSLDWRTRKAQYRETVPDFLIDEVTARLLPLIDPDG